MVTSLFVYTCVYSGTAVLAGVSSSCRVGLTSEAIASIPQIWSTLESYPQTLVHNDCNPRNLCMRSLNGDGAWGWGVEVLVAECMHVHTVVDDVVEAHGYGF